MDTIVAATFTAPTPAEAKIELEALRPVRSMMCGAKLTIALMPDHCCAAASVRAITSAGRAAGPSSCRRPGSSRGASARVRASTHAGDSGARSMPATSAAPGSRPTANMARHEPELANARSTR
jgi:hypothetical protein